MLYNQNSGYGRGLLNAIHSALGGPFGNVFIVMNSSDSDEKNYQKFQDVFKEDPEGNVRFFTSLATAYAATESNNNDVIVLDGNSTHTLTSTLAVTNNRVHFIGLDYLMGIRLRYVHSAKISATITSGATNIATIKNTGVRNTFRGLKISNASTVAQGLYSFADGGEYTYIECCEIYKSTDLDQAGAAELLCNGDSSHYKRCYIGSTVNAVTANGARPCILMNRETITGKVARDVTIEDCILARNAGDTDNAFIYGSGATDIERLMSIEGTLFFNTKLAAAAPDQAVEFDSALTQGAVVLRKGCASYNVTALSTTTGVFSADPTSANDAGEVTQLA